VSHGMSSIEAPERVAGDVAAIMRQARTENFPVASHLLGRRVRRDLRALYGFARLVDDTGDESAGDRLALLDRIEDDVDRLYRGEEPLHPLVAGVDATVRRCGIASAHLRALIEANRRDQHQAGYETFDDLLSYCELSANPVGRMVLCVLGASTPARQRLSDHVCTALQLAEHLQDVAEDLGRSRIYLPAEDMRRFGCTPGDLRAQRANHGVRTLIAFEVDRARELLVRGAPLVRTLRGRPALAVAGFVAGGHAALAAIEQAGYDVLAGPPRATRRQRLAALAAVLRR
jgi:squalene synthase HpnC